MASDRALIDLVRIELSPASLTCDLAHAIDDLGPAAVVERKRQRQLPIWLGELLGLFDALADTRRNPPAAPAAAGRGEVTAAAKGAS